MDLFDSLINPMLAFPSEPFDSKDWVFELKLDGTRCIAYIDVQNKKVRLLNRRLVWFENRYPELKRIWENIEGKKVILDGEIVVLKNGKPDFYLLEEREHVDNPFRIEILSKLHPAVYVVFDILYKDGKNLSGLSWTERRETLEETVKDGFGVIVSEYVEEKGTAFFEKVKKMKLEGIVAKKKDSVYLIGKRSKNWLKIKATKTIDAIICGFTKGEGKRKGFFGALLLGIYDDGKLRYIGRVGTGNWSEKRLEEIKKLLEKNIIKSSPFDVFEEERKIIEKTVFVKPKYIAEVEYLELTKEKKLRAPSFKRLRFDKEIKECVLEK